MWARSCSMDSRAAWYFSTQALIICVFRIQKLLVFKWSSCPKLTLHPILWGTTVGPSSTLTSIANSECRMEKGLGNDESASCKCCEMNTMPSWINHLSLMLSSGRTFRLTKSFNICMKCCKKNINMLETRPHIAISWIMWTNKCTWLVRMDHGKVSSRRHIASTTSIWVVSRLVRSTSFALTNRTSAPSLYKHYRSGIEAYLETLIDRMNYRWK
jgi:hypothetical protein